MLNNKLTVVQRQFLTYPFKKQKLIYKLAMQAQQYELLAHLIKVIPLQKRQYFI